MAEGAEAEGPGPMLAPPPMIPRHGEVHDVRLSKLMSKLLRHEALNAGVSMDAAGWVSITEALLYINHGPSIGDNGVWAALAGPPDERKTYTEAEVRKVIELNDKRRYELREAGVDNTSEAHIRARQVSDGDVQSRRVDDAR